MIKFFEKHNKLSLGITILIAIIIFCFSSISFEPVVAQKGNSYSIIYHSFIFFLLGVFFLISIIQGKEKNLKFLFLSFIILILYAVSDEIHQFFVPGRFCTFADVLFDVSGILLAGLGYLAVLSFRKI